jgi:TonB-dependent starch-binding outer membrane protein SusC
MKKILLNKVRYLFILHLLLLSVTGAWAQGIDIKGKVTSETGEGLPGVTVMLKGTTTGASTDPTGNYSLSAPSGTGTLLVSFIGYTTQEVAINNRTTINISLKPDAKALEEVMPKPWKRWWWWAMAAS